MNISALQVKTLRERTGAPMMQCKKFLIAANGDLDAAVLAMRKADPDAADKRADKLAAEGSIVISLSQDAKKAVIAEVNCETDFVARDEHFKQFAQLVAERANSMTTTIDIKAVMALKTAEDSQVTLDQMRQSLINKLGENIQLRRIDCIHVKQGSIGQYCHGGRIGVIVAINTDNESLSKDIAMHIAASSPKVVQAQQMPKAIVDAERDVYLAQAKQSGKSPDIIKKMVEGRINKFLKEQSLISQPFVKDSNIKVSDLLNSYQASVDRFVRYQVGEGIEKEAHDFASEVEAQVKNSAI